MKSYPEVERLQQHFSNHSIQIERLSQNSSMDSFWARLTINEYSWEVYVDDEYRDFHEDRQMMGLFLVLTSLDTYKESPDFLVWSQENFLDASEEKWLEYYRSLAQTYKEIEVLLGDMDPQISYYDYSMQTELGISLRELGP